MTVGSKKTKLAEYSYQEQQQQQQQQAKAFGQLILDQKIITVTILVMDMFAWREPLSRYSMGLQELAFSVASW